MTDASRFEIGEKVVVLSGPDSGQVRLIQDVLGTRTYVLDNMHVKDRTHLKYASDVSVVSSIGTGF